MLACMMIMETRTYRPISWVATIPQFLIYAGLFALVYVLTRSMDYAVFLGIGATLCYSLGSRYVLTHHHRKGLRLLREGRPDDAIISFERQLDFFKRYDWIDRYRAIVMMSPAAMSYTEMALCNIAHCCVQLDQTDQAVTYYRQAMEANPENMLAKAALKELDERP